MRTLPSLQRRQLAAFTLVEIILAMGIFLLMAGGIYLAVSTSVRASAELGTAQMDARKFSSFIRFLREGFSNLPAEAELSLRSRDQGHRGRSVELLIRRAAGAFETGALESFGSGVVLGALPDGKGKSRFSLMRFSDTLSESDRDRFLDQAEWLPVLENVELVKWRFWNPQQNQYVETWEPGQGRPELVELTLQAVGDPAITCFFRLPQLAKQGEAPAP